MSVTLMNERDIEFMLYELFDSESLIQRERYQDHDRHTFNEVINTAKRILNKLAVIFQASSSPLMLRISVKTGIKAAVTAPSLKIFL